MKVYYYIPLFETDASSFFNGTLRLSSADFEEEIFAFELTEESIDELARLSSYRGSAIKLTKEQYYEALKGYLEDEARDNPCSFRDGRFQISSENRSELDWYVQKFPQAYQGTFESDGERYYQVRIQF